MSTTTRHRHTSEVSADKLHRLELSRLEAAGLQLREIHCPFCDFLIDKVFSDVTGHKMIFCRKCKGEYPINLGYFRRVRERKQYDGFRFRRQHR